VKQLVAPKQPFKLGIKQLGTNQSFATSPRQPQPFRVRPSKTFMPAASHNLMTMSRTARTSSRLAPLLIAPLRCPFNCGFTCSLSARPTRLNGTSRLVGSDQRSAQSCSQQPSRHSCYSKHNHTLVELSSRDLLCRIDPSDP
jgi:hypothetical protein